MSKDKQPDLARREFLQGGAGAAAGLTLAPGVMLFGPAASAKPIDEPASSTTRWGMLIDANKCASGCDACVTACNEEHGLGDETQSGPRQQTQYIRKVELRNKATGASHSLPMMCQHCETPPCADVCPTGASFKRADGIVLVDRHICIGCRYCMMACPYKARSFVHESLDDQQPYTPRGKGCVESCTLCVHRIDLGGIPACAEACGVEGNGAILFGDLNDPDSEIARAVAEHATTEVRADLGLNQGVRYQGI